MLTIDIPDPLSRKLSGELHLLKASPYSRFEDFLSGAGAIFARLPEPIAQVIREFKTGPFSPAALLIRNLPLDMDLPETPADPDQPSAKQTFISEGCLLGLGELVGEPFGYAEEKGGDIIRTVVPAAGQETSKSGEGSAVDFELHTEIAWSNFRPDFIALYCLRRDPQNQAATCISECRKAVPCTSEDDLSVLREPRFQIRAPESFRKLQLETEGWSVPKPILTGPDSLPEISINLNFTRFLDRRAEEAFNRFRDILIRVMESIHLEPGKLLLINNRTAAHGRTAYNPSFDGHDRWLQQIYLRKDLWSARPYKNVAPRLFLVSR
jgi:L-asparagine oxygenase